MVLATPIPHHSHLQHSSEVSSIEQPRLCDYTPSFPADNSSRPFRNFRLRGPAGNKLGPELNLRRRLRLFPPRNNSSLLIKFMVFLPRSMISFPQRLVLLYQGSWRALTAPSPPTDRRVLDAYNDRYRPRCRPHSSRERYGYHPKSCSNNLFWCKGTPRGARRGWNFSVKGSFIEIYNEDLLDLLADDHSVGGRRKVQIREEYLGGYDVSSHLATSFRLPWRIRLFLLFDFYCQCSRFPDSSSFLTFLGS